MATSGFPTASGRRVAAKSRWQREGASPDSSLRDIRTPKVAAQDGIKDSIRPGGGLYLPMSCGGEPGTGSRPCPPGRGQTTELGHSTSTVRRNRRSGKAPSRTSARFAEDCRLSTRHFWRPFSPTWWSQQLDAIVLIDQDGFHQRPRVRPAMFGQLREARRLIASRKKRDTVLPSVTSPGRCIAGPKTLEQSRHRALLRR